MQESGRLRHDADTSDRHHNKAKNIAMTISLPPDIYDKLIDYSTEKGRTRAGMVRYIIERYMTGKPLESVSKT